MNSPVSLIELFKSIRKPDIDGLIVTDHRRSHTDGYNLAIDRCIELARQHPSVADVGREGDVLRKADLRALIASAIRFNFGKYHPANIIAESDEAALAVMEELDMGVLGSTHALKEGGFDSRPQSPHHTVDANKMMGEVDDCGKAFDAYYQERFDPKTIDSEFAAILWHCWQAARLPKRESGWQPIETAPKDGTHFLVWWANRYHAPITIHWNDGKWNNDRIGWKWSGWSSPFTGDDPTHWMPLPKPPINVIEGDPT